MVEKCPNCDIENDANSQCCECGYVFVDETLASQASDSVHILSIQRKYRRRKVVVVSLVFVAAVTFALFFLGVFYRAYNNDVPQETPAPVAQTVPTEENTPESSTTQVPIDGQSYKVVRVFTGSIIEVADNNDQEYRISLFGVHAPKLDESFGAESKQNLSNLILGKTVFIRTRNSDGNDDFVAEVICGGLNAGIAQLQDGLVFPLNDQISRLSENLRRQYDKAELSAKTNRYGVWSGMLGDISTTEVAAAPFEQGQPGFTRTVSELTRL